jgi:hypothetical protein
MKKTVFWALTLALSVALLFSAKGEPAGKAAAPSERALVAALKTKPIPDREWEGPESKKMVEIYNELAAELEERAISYASGGETEAGLFDVMNRVFKAGLEASRVPSHANLRLEVLTKLAKQAEVIRTTMEKRTKNKKVNAAQARADLRRAKAFCLEVNLEKWRAQRWVVPGRPDVSPPRPVAGGGIKANNPQGGQPKKAKP